MNPALKQRVVTGVILVVCVFLGVLLLPTSWFSVFSLIVLISLGGMEWGKLVSFSETSLSLFVLALLLLAFLAYLMPDLRWLLIVVGVLWWLTTLVLLLLYKQGTTFYKSNQWLLRLSAFLVLVPAWLALTALHQHYPQLVLYLIFLVAIADSGAYFTGKAFGENKLAPELSPGKTIEGAMGGLVGAMVWSVLGALYFGLFSQGWFFFILLSLAVAMLSIAGDLFESLIKREAGQKDSGTLLPGHGGILDRIDGLLAALPLFTLGIYWGAIQV